MIAEIKELLVGLMWVLAGVGLVGLSLGLVAFLAACKYGRSD